MQLRYMIHSVEFEVDDNKTCKHPQHYTCNKLTKYLCNYVICKEK